MFHGKFEATDVCEVQDQSGYAKRVTFEPRYGDDVPSEQRYLHTRLVMRFHDPHIIDKVGFDKRSFFYVHITPVLEAEQQADIDSERATPDEICAAADIILDYVARPIEQRVPSVTFHTAAALIARSALHSFRTRLPDKYPGVNAPEELKVDTSGPVTVVQPIGVEEPIKP